MDCQGHKISYKGSGSKDAGVSTAYDDVTIKNCVIDGFPRGAVIWDDAHSASIENVQFTNISDSAAIQVHGKCATLKDVTISNTEWGYGLAISDTVDHITLDGVTSCYNGGDYDIAVISDSEFGTPAPVSIHYGGKNGKTVYCDNCPDIRPKKKRSCSAHPTLTQSPTSALTNGPTSEPSDAPSSVPTSL